MIIKVYNQCGKIKVTKICGNGLEQTIFSDIQNGEAATIEIGTSQYTKAKKGKSEEAHNEK